MKARAKSAGDMGRHTSAPRPVSPGQPENALPRWYHLPLDAKIPLPRVVPKGKAVMYPAKAGEPLWRTLSASLGLDLNDPLLMQLPGPHEYNPLHDPFASGHLRRPDLQNALYCHGLVTRHGFCLCSLKNFNRFREYLHSVNLRQVKHKRTEVEKPLRTEYEHLALDVVREERRKEEELQPETANEGGAALSARYSDIMRDEESKLPDHLPDYFSLLTNKEKLELNEENKTFATIRFAKIQSREARLAAIKCWLRKDGRKAALLRLRKLQIMEDRRKKGINNWKTRTAVQSECFEELRNRERREAEARRVHQAEKQRYLSAIGFVHNVKYDEVVRKWHEKRLRSAATRIFCGYADDVPDILIEPKSITKEKLANAEIQTDPQNDLLLNNKQTILFDRSTGLVHDITEGFNANDVREYESAAKQLVDSAIFVHSEIILPATSRYKAEQEKADSEDRGGDDAAVQTSDSLQLMDPIQYRPASADEPKHETVTSISHPVQFADRLAPGGQEDDAISCHSSAESSSCRKEIVYSTVENEVLRDLKESKEPTDKVEMLVVALEALERVADGAEDDSVDDPEGVGPIHRLLICAREVLAEAIDIRRNSSVVVEEIVRLAIDDIARLLLLLQQEEDAAAPDGRRSQQREEEEGRRSAEHRRGRHHRAGRGRGGRRGPGQSMSAAQRGRRDSVCRYVVGADLLTYVVRKAVSIAERTDEADAEKNRSGVRQSEVSDKDDEFIPTFLRRISGGEEEAAEQRPSALVTACDDFNDALCDRYTWMDLSDRELMQLAKDRTTNEANRLVTTSVKNVLEDLAGEEELDLSDILVSHDEADRAIAEALLNLALHRDLELITRGYKDPHQIVDLVARIVRTHGSVRDSAAVSFGSVVGEGYSPSTRWHLSSILLSRLIKAALDRAVVDQSTCGLTTEILISLAAAVNLRGLASKVVLLQPKKGRMRRRCPKQPPVIDQTQFRSAMIDTFNDKMKQLVDLAVISDACVDHALSRAIQMAAPTSSLMTSPKKLSQQTTALFADVKSIVADAARVLLRKTVGSLATKFRATNDCQVESVLGQIESALSDIDAYGLLSNESQLGLRAKNSLVLSRERLKEISPSTHWSTTEHSDSDEEVHERVTRKLSVSSKVVRVTLVPTDQDLIHEPHLSTPESVNSPIPHATAAAAPAPAAPAAIKAPQSSSAVDDLVDLVEDLSVLPMFGNVPLDIDPTLVTEDLLVLSIKNDEDLDSPKLSMRNSFRNVHRPDVSSLRRFSSSSSSYSGGPDGSIHDRVKGVFIQRKTTMEDDSQRPVQRSEDDSEYVINKVNIPAENSIPAMDSIPEFWPKETVEGADEAPAQSTVTTEYSKEYSFPEDVKEAVSAEKNEEDLFPASPPVAQPLVSGSVQLGMRPEKAPDEISMISFLYGDPEEFHNLKISSMIVDYEDSSDLIGGERPNATQKRRDRVVPQPRYAESDGKPVEESDEIVIVTREIYNPAELNLEEVSSDESSKKQTDVADDLSEKKPVSMATNDHVALNLEGAATELLKHDDTADSSFKRHELDRSTDSVILPPVPTNSHEDRSGDVTEDTATGSVITAGTQPLGVAADFKREDVDHEGVLEDSKE